MGTIRSIRLASLYGVVAGLVAGCDVAETVDPAVAVSSGQIHGSAKVQPVPFKASYTWRIVGQAPSPGCDGPGEARSFLEGEGNATYLGRFTITLNHCGRPGLPLSDGHGTFVSADGDLLYINYFGVGGLTGAPPIFNFESSVEFAGGTGRFAHATGTATVLGTIDVRILAGTGDWEGEISSPRGD